ncbi:MAG: 50S ribosomal protein L11 methyltransferase [Saprospiraceae bacterium]|nr:50S ribosomal protein L11 methyltransferase [Saprospiraceae bacterium]
MPEYQEYIDSLQEVVPFICSIEQDEEKNWNALWEADFKEIVIDDFCIIRAPFHHPNSQFPFEIVIEPRMAFGTGHHETTRLMMRSMQMWSYSGKSDAKVLDFGSGSGVLAILAGKMGAAEISAIENDEHAFVNLKENINYNDQPIISAHCKDHLREVDVASLDLVLANITRNVLQEHASDLARILAKNGALIVSGFLKKDHEVIVDTFNELGLISMSFLEENDWIAQTFQKNINGNYTYRPGTPAGGSL